VEEGAGGYLVFSDIPANELKQWSEKAGTADLSARQQQCQWEHGGSAGGRLVTAEHSARRISEDRVERDGDDGWWIDTTVRASTLPNDSGGQIRRYHLVTTDPPYGLPKDEAKEQPGISCTGLIPIQGDKRGGPGHRHAKRPLFFAG